MASWKSIGRLFGIGGDPPLAGARSRFAWELCARLRRPGQNLVFSPDSVRMALGMALACARGETAAELARALHLDGASAADVHAVERARLEAFRRPGREYVLSAANGLFASRSLALDPAGVALLETDYLATVERLDFEGHLDASRDRINAWVSEATRGLIPEVLGRGSLREDTRLILADALYFKAEWATKFDLGRTSPAPFTLLSGESVPVPTMHQTAEHRVFTGPEAEVLEMGYRGGELAMTFVLPPPGARFEDFESSLQTATLDAWLSKPSRETVRLALPRFDVDGGSISLKQPLMDTGITRVFQPDQCDFGGITREPVAVGEVLHRARLTVTEEGTEAAAATLAIAPQAADRRKLKSFQINRPFLFLLRDLRDKSILFMGRVTDPRAR